MKKSEQGTVLRKVGGLENTLMKVFSIVVDIKENMVTRQEFRSEISKIYNHIDGFVKLHTTIDTEVASLRHGYDRLDDRVNRVEKRIGLEDSVIS